MTKTKRISTALLAILSLFLFSFALTACGESKIELVEDFKLEYNIGEELDVSGGVIKYTNGGEEKLVSLTADMVTGFNSQTAGERTLIITYEGLQTTVKYTVAPEYVTLNLRYTCTTPGVQNYLIFTDETTMVYTTTYPDLDPVDTTFANGTREIKDNKWEITFKMVYEGELPEQYTDRVVVTVNSPESITLSFISNENIEANVLEFEKASY